MSLAQAPSLPLVGRVGAQRRGGGCGLHPSRLAALTTLPMKGRDGRGTGDDEVMDESISRTNLTRARALRKAMTKPEVLMWLALRELKIHGFRFRRQAPIRGYILDFVCHQSKLIIEIDGDHHGYPEQQQHDATRDAIFRAEGFAVLRMSNNEVSNNRDGVVQTIYRLGVERLGSVAKRGRRQDTP